MGSSPSKAKPGGRPTGKNRRPPAKKPPPRDDKKTERKIGANDYYTLEMVNGQEYDPRDDFLDGEFYPKSDPFSNHPVGKSNPRQSVDEDFVEPSDRRLPQPRPQRQVAQEPDDYRQPWEPGTVVPYTNAPPRFLRSIEPKEGHVTDDIISVQVEPESRGTERPRPYQNRWPEDRRYHRYPVPQRIPPTMPSYMYQHGGYRSQSQIYGVPRERRIVQRHTSMSEHPHGVGRQRYNHTVVPSLIPHRRDAVVPVNPTLIIPPRGNVIPSQQYVIQPQVHSIQPQQEASVPREEPSEPVISPQESVLIQRSYLPPNSDANVRFYRSEIRFRPNGVFIDDIHKHWYGDYDILENDHTYLQWLFPLPEGSGANPEAQPLKPDEIEEMRRDSRIKRRLLKSYMLMLDFYGISLSDRDFGKLQRADNYKSRFLSLNNSSHNSYRITRIIRCLGILGLKHYQLPLVMFLLNEVLVTKRLFNIRDSNLEHWIDAISDSKDKEAALTFYIDHVSQRHQRNTSHVTSFHDDERVEHYKNKGKTGENKRNVDNDSVVFTDRRDYEDVEDDFDDETINLAESYNSGDRERLTEIPPLQLGLLRRSP